MAVGARIGESPSSEFRVLLPGSLPLAILLFGSFVGSYLLSLFGVQAVAVGSSSGEQLQSGIEMALATAAARGVEEIVAGSIAAAVFSLVTALVLRGASPLLVRISVTALIGVFGVWQMANVISQRDSGNPQYLLLATVAIVLLEQVPQRRRTPVSRFSLLSVYSTVLVAVYFGLYVLPFESGASAWIALASAFSVIYGVRRVRRRERRRGRLLAALVPTAGMAVLLSVSLSEFRQGLDVGFAPEGEPWRSLYFSGVLAIYVCVAAVDRVPSIVGTAPVTKTGTSKVALVVPAALLVLVPAFSAFTPHGVVLYVSSALWLWWVYSDALFKMSVLDHTEWSRPTRQLSASFMMLLLFVLLAADRIFYYSTLEHLSPALPIVFGFTGLFPLAAAVDAIVLRPRKESLGTHFRAQLKQVGELGGIASPLAKTLVGVAVASAVGILLSVATYFLYLFRNNVEANGLNGDYVAPPLEGLGGVYALSWTALSFTANVLFAAAAWLYLARRDS